METTSDKLHQYIICIGTEGFEGMHEIPEDIAQDATIAKLQGKNIVNGGTTGQWLSAMSLRIRFNSHRDIKCYLLSVNIDANTTYEMLQTEYFQELVKKKGVLYNL